MRGGSSLLDTGVIVNRRAESLVAERVVCVGSEEADIMHVQENTPLSPYQAGKDSRYFSNVEQQMAIGTSARTT